MKLNTKTILCIIQILLIFSSDVLLANAKIKLISRSYKSHLFSTRHQNQSWIRKNSNFIPKTALKMKILVSPLFASGYSLVCQQLYPV